MAKQYGHVVENGKVRVVAMPRGHSLDDVVVVKDGLGRFFRKSAKRK